MKYFRFSETISLKQVGKFPQVEETKYVTSWDSPSSLEMVYLKEININHIEVPEFRLYKKAKRTDLVSKASLSFRLLLSPKFKLLLESRNYCGIQFIETKLHHSNASEQFWILNPFGFRNNYVNISDSLIQCDYGPDAKTLMGSNKKEFTLLQEEMRALNKICWFSMVVLKKTEIKDDFFLLNNVFGGIGYYVSEKFKNEICESGITGVEFKEIG